ncbi:hypothetical protein NEOC65_000533 [Neochlamydia sp. AcF65]|nr:hypothetical protein [Neochlamydia sp. AcF65]
MGCGITFHYSLFFSTFKGLLLPSLLFKSFNLIQSIFSTRQRGGHSQ